MRENRYGTYSFQQLYNLADKIHVPVASETLLADIKKMVTELKPEVISPYEPWLNEEDEDDESQGEESLQQDWIDYFCSFFNSCLIYYLRFKTRLGTFTLGKSQASVLDNSPDENFSYLIFDYAGNSAEALQEFFATLHFKSEFKGELPESRVGDLVYFVVNNWFSYCNYPATMQMEEWMGRGFSGDALFNNPQWVKKNRLVVYYNEYDMSDSYAVTAPLEWVRKNCPEILGSVYEVISYDGAPPPVKRPFIRLRPYGRDFNIIEHAGYISKKTWDEHDNPILKEEDLLS